MADVGGIAGDRLRSFIERIERLEEEKRALAQDIKEVFAEAKGTGFDTRIMRQLIKERRMDKDDLDEQQTLLDVYRRALGMLVDTPLGEAALEKRQRRAATTKPADKLAEAAAESHARVDKLVDKFIDSVTPHAGDSVAITIPGKGGIRISNRRGKKSVERVTADPPQPANLAEVEAAGAEAARRDRPTTEDCPYPYPPAERGAWERGWASSIAPAMAEP